MFIQTEDTPNPQTMKFLPGRAVMQAGTLEFKNAAAAAASPLAAALFALDGVEGVFLATDFISVTKSADKSWQVMKPSVLTTIMDHFVAQRPVVAEESSSGHAAAAKGEDAEIVEKICALLDAKIRPAVAQDGGDITFHSFESGVVFLNLKGACAGCPSSTATLKAGVENMLRHYVPEVVEVRQVR